MEFTPENITGLLIRSKLMGPQQVRSLYERWLKEGKDNVKSTPHYLKWIVGLNHLTEYQAALIAHGHADNFFLGQYKIIDRLGRGRMAGVYKALHNLGQIVAVKVLPPSRAKDKQLLARFEREARLAMQLKHPNVVRSFQVGETRGLNYLVMEYLDGETLEDVLNRRKKLPVNEAVRLAFQALQGLQHIHDKSMIHRDLKPANIMLVPSRRKGDPDNTLSATAKILDIGLGREMFDETAQSQLENLELTGEGVLLGTPDYLAPEQARDPRTIDIRADIYGIGCILYHCLAGQPPFPDKNVLNQMVRHATEKPAPVKQFSPEVPDGLQQVLDWMLAKKPEQRYPTPERAAKAMQVFMVAGEDVQKIEDMPQMRRYLTWLETKESDEEKEKKIKIEPKSGPKQKGKDKKRKRRKKGETPVPEAKSEVPVAKLSASSEDEGAAEGADVELVAIPGGGDGMDRSLLSLTKRDWMLLGIGAGAVLLAVGFGFLLSQLMK